MEDFNAWDIPKLKDFLKTVDIQYSGYRKEVLIKLCKCVCELGLQAADPTAGSQTITTS